jgi:class 3 adenylate cyclase/CHASE2 domain-containing sensor protein
MTRQEKKLLKLTIQLGIVLTIIVIGLDGLGVLGWLERALYDFRARDCQYFSPPPTDRIVHLDIDDSSVQEIGKWPWPRTKMAMLVEEIHEAGAKLLATDIILAEPQDTRWLKPDANNVSHSVDDDAQLAKALRDAHNVLLPLSLRLERTIRSPVYLETRRLLLQSLELNANEIAEKLRNSPVDSKTLASDVRDAFIEARKEAMFQRVNESFDKNVVDPAKLHEALTPIAYGRDLKTDASLLLDDTMLTVQSVRNILRFTAPIPREAPPLVSAEVEQAVTIPALTDAIAYCGYVDFIKSRDGNVRSIPLFVNYRGRLIPHMAMATACALLDVNLDRIQFTEHTVILPLPSGENLVIPIRTENSPDFGQVGAIMDIPWFGTKDWLTAFDVPRHQDSKQHIPLNTVWRICQLRTDLASIDEKVDDALKAIVSVYRTSLKQAAAFVDSPLEKRTREQRVAAMKEVVSEVGPLIDLSVYDKMKPSEFNEDEKLFVPAYRALLQAQRSIDINAQNMRLARAALREKLNGRAAMFGFTATGMMDTYTTSLHALCPGVVIQGAAVNGIVTRELWWSAPWWQTALITLLVGLAVTIAVAALQPVLAGLCTIGIMALYFILNGIVLFDWGNMVYGAAGPLTAAFIVWGSLTVGRYISERRHRSKIEARFRSYVDPQVVNFAIENIEKAAFDGEVRLMSVVFTDLAGFTTISEQLRERTVPLLNDYMSLMLPIIRQHSGVWNKFLGDGIMFFFGAPHENLVHARDAVESVLQMQKALIGFNDTLREKKLPAVSMRAGISTGSMIVGDAGSLSPQASDYTVLGDEVNLGARLESANKYLGSRVLMNDLAAQLCGDDFLIRPMGNICVKGKTEGVMSYEPLCHMSDATPAQKQLAKLSTEIVDCFRTSEFNECVRCATALEEEFGSSAFTQLYLNLSRLYVVEPPGEKFDGQIILAEK